MSILTNIPKRTALTATLAVAVAAAAGAPVANADAPPGAPSTADAAPNDAKVRAQAQPTTPAAGDVIPGRFIVKVRHGKDPKAVADESAAKPKFVFRDAFNGFSADLDSAKLAKLKRHPQVEGIEPVTVASATATQTYDLPWGLDRIDQRYRPLSGSMTYGHTGAGVNAYIVDSGIQTSHPQFGGRASAVYDNVGDGRAGQDCAGHGTHVAGTVGGATYGVAKAVRLYSVRVLNCSGTTTSDKEMAALNWLRVNARHPAVVNVSIGGPKNTYLNQAVTNLANSGVFVSVAAGNSNADACNASPASAPGSFTAAASNSYDQKWASSNWGGCVDGYAPGVGVKSAYLNSTTTFMNGTSMAAPHVAGIIALAKSAYGDSYTTSSWVSWLINNATPNVISGNYSGTPNRLVFKGTL
jgi:subtilisin family serine protease